MPRLHWRDFSAELRAKLTAKDIRQETARFKRWEEERQQAIKDSGMTEDQYTKHMAELAAELFKWDNDD